jgi:hypothetical protein
MLMLVLYMLQLNCLTMLYALGLLFLLLLTRVPVVHLHGSKRKVHQNMIRKFLLQG